MLVKTQVMFTIQNKFPRTSMENGITQYWLICQNKCSNSTGFTLNNILSHCRLFMIKKISFSLDLDTIVLWSHFLQTVLHSCFLSTSVLYVHYFSLRILIVNNFWIINRFLAFIITYYLSLFDKHSFKNLFTVTATRDEGFCLFCCTSGNSFAGSDKMLVL